MKQVTSKNKITPTYDLNVKRLTVYLEPALDSQIRQLAKIEDRSLSNIAERSFRAYLSMAAPQLTNHTNKLEKAAS